MDTGANKDKNQRRDDRIRNAYIRLQPLGVLGIALVDALKEFLAVLDILRVRIDLIHQPILLAVLFSRPVRHLLHKPDNILGVGRRLLHKVVLDLFHTVRRRLNNQLVKVFEIRIKICLCAAARICQRFNSRAREPVFRVTLKAFFPLVHASAHCAVAQLFSCCFAPLYIPNVRLNSAFHFVFQIKEVRFLLPFLNQ